MTEYVELHCHSAFSLLDGGALPELLIARAADLGYAALALTDHDELGGAVRFAQAGSELGVRAIIGAELTFSAPASPRLEFSAGANASDFSQTEEEQQIRAGGAAENIIRPAGPAENALHHIVLLAENRTGYGNFSTLITLGRMNNTRGEPSVDLDTLARHAD